MDKPNLENEMDELQRVSQDLSRDEGIDIPVDELVKAFKKSKEQKITNDIWSKLENTESHEIKRGEWSKVMDISKKYNKTNPKKLKSAIESGEYERPLILDLGGRYILVAGNTRLSTAAAMGVNPMVFVARIYDNEQIKKLIYKAHTEITRKKGKDYAPDVHELQKWINDYMYVDDINENEKLVGGNADHKSLVQIAKKHDAKGYYHIDDMVKSLKKQLAMGLKVEKEHTDDEDKAREIALDHLWEDPNYYSKLKKMETDESTGADSAGAFSGPLFGKTILKRDIKKIHNANLTEVLDASGFDYDVPFGGDTPKGKKNPLKINGPESIYKGRAVTDKNFPRYGGPKGIFVKIKDKCKKFPYCNQGDTGALEFINEDNEIQTAINEVSKSTGIPKNQLIKIVFNEIKQIFINNEN